MQCHHLDEPDTDKFLRDGRLAISGLDYFVSQVASISVSHDYAQLVVACVKVTHLHDVAVPQVHHDPNFLHLEVVLAQVVHDLLHARMHPHKPSRMSQVRDTRCSRHVLKILREGHGVAAPERRGAGGRGKRGVEVNAGEVSQGRP